MEETRVASLSPASEGHTQQARSVEFDVPPPEKSLAIDAPTPPRRPKDLAKVADLGAVVDAPLPPRRPWLQATPELAAAPVVAPFPTPRPKHLSARDSHPPSRASISNETTGSIEPSANEIEPLAFAPPPSRTAKAKKPAGAPVEDEKTKLGRSDFNVLPGMTPSNGPSALVIPTGAAVSSFGDTKTPPPTNGFVKN